MGKSGTHQKEKSELLKQQRLGATNYNSQGCLMKVVEYNRSGDIIVEFQDEYKYKKKTKWDTFCSGMIKNYYYAEVFGVGIVGKKYPTKIHYQTTKEYQLWYSMLSRCFDQKMKNRCQSYKNVTCCKEWLLFENFYEWLHSQENFEMWKNNKGFALDKDIIQKGNKVYGPDVCCLVPVSVNSIFVKSDGNRGKLPIGVRYDKSVKKYYGSWETNRQGVVIRKSKYVNTPEEAFQFYKGLKEIQIKQVAKEEYEKGTISKKCYEAMMKWEVEIGD